MYSSLHCMTHCSASTAVVSAQWAFIFLVVAILKAYGWLQLSRLRCSALSAVTTTAAGADLIYARKSVVDPPWESRLCDTMHTYNRAMLWDNASSQPVTRPKSVAACLNGAEAVVFGISCAARVVALAYTDCLSPQPPHRVTQRKRHVRVEPHHTP